MFLNIYMVWISCHQQMQIWQFGKTILKALILPSSSSIHIYTFSDSSILTLLLDEYQLTHKRTRTIAFEASHRQHFRIIIVINRKTEGPLTKVSRGISVRVIKKETWTSRIGSCPGIYHVTESITSALSRPILWGQCRWISLLIILDKGQKCTFLGM